jgi:prepilin-type N-terminal cleavage/methylation domain-containing protein
VNGSAVSVACSLLRRSREERGFTLVELIVTMAIMLFVITALVQLMTSGTRAENDLNLRFQAQEAARLGLDVFRREVHNACAATVSGGGTQVTLMTNDQSTRGSFPCNVVGSNWCTSGSGTRFQLYRQAGSGACGSGVIRADYLISGAIFSLPAPTAGELPKVGIDMTVNRQTSTPQLQYRLDDAIALRNARRT